MSAEHARVARRHASLRWLGVPMFVVGFVGFLAALGIVLAEGASWGGPMLYVAATGLSLATFGTHNDTALALTGRASAAAPDFLRAELERELQRDRAALSSIKATPVLALVVTLIALTLHLLGLRWLVAAI